MADGRGIGWAECGCRNQDEIIGEVEKIDSEATDGLLGVHDSLAYRVAEIEKHFHNRERWFGKAIPQTVTDWAADNLNPFVAISGAGVYGADANDEALVFGSDDDVIAGDVYFDLGQMNVVAASATTPYKVRIIWGTGTMADAITAGQYTETMVQIAAAGGRQGAFPFKMPRIATGTQVWVQVKNATDNATLSFFVGGHPYPG